MRDIEQELRKGPGIFHLFTDELKMISRYRLQNDATGVQPRRGPRTRSCDVDGTRRAIDDGKANAVSSQFIEEVNAAPDQAEQDKAVTILTGRPGRFSAGLDLSALLRGGEIAARLVRTGALLCSRLPGFPTPVILACNGHSLALGALLLLAADCRIGTEGNCKIGTNEVAIGMPLPSFGVELARLRWRVPCACWL